MSERLQYTTLAIQLSNDEGLPYDMPDDWVETIMSIASMINAKYKCGMDLVYGLATKEGMDIISEEVGQ